MEGPQQEESKAPDNKEDKKPERFLKNEPEAIVRGAKKDTVDLYKKKEKKKGCKC